MSRNKTIIFGKSDCAVEDLRKALSRCKKGSKVKLIFCTNEYEEETIEETKLKDLCDRMYYYLSYASDCVDICAKNEKKTGKNTIYYEDTSGYNCGAQRLRKDINKFLNDYHKERVQIDLGVSRKEFED